MDKDEEFDDEDEEVRKGKRRGYRERRRSSPRIGSFVTIAVALLLLFGAASRMGKVPETAALFGIDQQTEQRINAELGRVQAALTLGAVPVSISETARTVPVDDLALPPARDEVDLDELRRQQEYARRTVSMAVPVDRGSESPLRPEPERATTVQGDTRPARNAQPAEPVRQAAQPARVDSYTVAVGDTWAKISQRTLGDAKRWQEIQKANPKASNGLTVGMTLKIPH